tara:strand:+ start:189 stop:518 length:330 start_codon:yes stop_codon:yes gene_type:complete
MYIKYIKVYYPNTEVGEIMQLRLLRIDETMLPFMNGDGLEDIPTFMDCALIIKYTINDITYLEKADKTTTWRNLFVKLDQLLIDSKETQHRDLAGVSIKKGVIRPIWVR